MSIKITQLLTNVAMAILPTADEFARTAVSRSHDVALQMTGCVGFYDVAFAVSHAIAMVAKKIK